MRASSFILLMAVGLLPGQPVGAEVLREQSRRSVPSAGLTTIVVQNPRGRTEARPSPDSNLHITALKIARGSRKSDAQEASRATTVELAREGSRYVVRVRYPRRESVRVNFWEPFDLSVPRLEVRITVEVPRGMAVELAASSGDLMTQGLSAPQSLRSSSGDVSVERAAGNVEVTTASGDVSITDASSAHIGTSSGDVEASGRTRALVATTSSGDVEVGEVAESLRIETVSGDISVDRAAKGAEVRTTSGEVRIRSVGGFLTATSVSGEIQVGLAAPLREATIVTSSGDIRAGLGQAVGCRLEMRSSSGSFDLDVPVRAQTLSRRLVTGVVGNGAASVSLRSSSGNIAVVLGEP
jgi:DUF4097 and DUF4098 domain-containing protein YvlB